MQLKKLSIYISQSNSIYHNLALEEYLLNTQTKDFLVIYRNSPAVVIGKHQNPWLEVNLESAQNNKISIARRMSGGGTVYHDLGNINFSFIRTKSEDFANFKEHIIPISNALSNLGVKNHITDRNDIFIDENKISGNAEHVNNKNKRIIHHGTLLYNSDIENLSKSIKPHPISISTHAVNSVRSPVINIKSIVDLGDTNEFQIKFIEQVKNQINVDEIIKLNPKNSKKINLLVQYKYKTWEWNFGYSPQFKFTAKDGNNYKIRKGEVIESSNNENIGYAV